MHFIFFSNVPTSINNDDREDVGYESPETKTTYRIIYWEGVSKQEVGREGSVVGREGALSRQVGVYLL